ncbi:odorant receptor 2a-like [Phymastichus coffea]|uniref:odorant receptor 2a-like n=1 Tax=Phymastichus coffea TaxID=108790 RepID=UPI00273C649D|nr:odorant receptor 2a-like [Phymastichus coffea]
MNEVKDKIPLEHKIFCGTFFYLRTGGFWKPTTIKQQCIGLIVVGSVVDMLTPKEDAFGHFVKNWCLTGIVSHTWSNGVNVALKRKRILDVLQKKIMIERWTCFRDPEESKIIEDSKDTEEKVLKYWMSLVFVNGIMNMLVPVITENPDNNLMWDSWVPCDKRVSSCFYICWSQQVISWITATIIHVSAGTIALNFMERICSHFRILQHRLTLVPDLVKKGVLNTAEDELFYLNECIRDHQNIYSTIVDISKIFYPVIFMHFVLILSILCTNIYLLSTVPLFTGDFTAVALFLCCMMSHFFIFCWWGYKLTEVGNDVTYTIFSMNWLELRKETRKRLRFMMLSASKTIPLFNNFIVDLSPEMFLKILKVSYSAFNLLQTQN